MRILSLPALTVWALLNHRSSHATRSVFSEVAGERFYLGALNDRKESAARLIRLSRHFSVPDPVDFDATFPFHHLTARATVELVLGYDSRTLSGFEYALLPYERFLYTLSDIEVIDPVECDQFPASLHDFDDTSHALRAYPLTDAQVLLFYALCQRLADAQMAGSLYDATTDDAAFILHPNYRSERRGLLTRFRGVWRVKRRTWKSIFSRRFGIAQSKIGAEGKHVSISE